ncbi:hypothetical protein D9611_007502 [Ephemerocybe angulata]|uniref:Uncharacterized protein n=1 Tax=Ephemerocybe angulata TaxID=980116 RepID=A0A8H5FL31_9AGAR|nr:hypothetical protein D9611_007502 [Tulosesus angulatus]
MEDAALAGTNAMHPSSDNLSGFSTIAGRHMDDKDSYTNDNYDSKATLVGSGEGRLKPSNTYSPPSLHTPARRVHTTAQQGSTMPGDGSEVRVDENGHLHGPSTHEVPFRDRVAGVAQITRGALLGKPELKEHGEAILEGKATNS